jgi:hypothetical protein
MSLLLALKVSYVNSCTEYLVYVDKLHELLLPVTMTSWFKYEKFPPQVHVLNAWSPATGTIWGYFKRKGLAGGGGWIIVGVSLQLIFDLWFLLFLSTSCPP